MYHTLRRLFIIACSILSIGALESNAFEKDSPQESTKKQTQHFNLKKQTALKGYDPVAYFTLGKAVKGDAKFQYLHNGVNYQFSSLENLKKFKLKPNYYQPQYGGWCAYAFAVGGGKVSINPKRFKIVDNKLYLFYDTLLGPNTLKKWNKANDKEQIKKADKRWAEIIS